MTGRHPTEAQKVFSILRAVSKQSGISFDLLLNGSRGRAPIALARQCCMWIAHTQLELTLSNIGEILGRDRTTVRHACLVVEEKRDNSEFQDYLARFIEACGFEPDNESTLWALPVDERLAAFHARAVEAASQQLKNIAAL